MNGRPHDYPNGTQPHYVYRCYDATGVLIYVGCSINPVARIAQHRAAAWWGYQIATVRHIVFPNRPYALLQERIAIGEERPRWNVKGRWNHRSLWTAEDYVDYHVALVATGDDTYYRSQHLATVRIEAARRYGLQLTAEGAIA